MQRWKRKAHKRTPRRFTEPSAVAPDPRDTSASLSRLKNKFRSVTLASGATALGSVMVAPDPVLLPASCFLSS
jgi:hypothetical protein